MTHSDDIDELDLLALADGLLDDDPARKAQVEAAVARSAPAAARLADYRAQTAALRAAYTGVLAEPVPARLRVALDDMGEGGSGRRLRRAAAVMLMFAAGVGGWWLGQGREDPMGQALLDESYRQFALRDSDRVGSALAERATGTQRSIGWVEADVAIRLSAPDLSSEGFKLIDKRALRNGEDQIVALDYAATDGRAFSLFIAPRWENRPGPIVEEERGGIALTYWHDGPLALSIAARLPTEEARRLAQTVRRAMRDETTAPPASLEPDFRPLGDTAEGIMADTLSAKPDAGSVGAVQGSAPAVVEPN